MRKVNPKSPPVPPWRTIVPEEGEEEGEEGEEEEGRMGISKHDPHAQAASLSLSLSSRPHVPCKAGAQAVHSVALAPVGTLNVLFRSFNGFPDQEGSTAAQ